MATDYSVGVGFYVTFLYIFLFAGSYFFDQKRPQVSPETSFRVISQSWKPEWSTTLLFTRIVSFCWFLGVAFFGRIVYYDTYKGHGGEYFKWFTHWNIILIWVYFGLASSLSLIRYLGDDRLPTQCQPQPQSRIDRYKLAQAARMIGDVVVINAPMVTIIIYGLLDRDMDFWNMTAHLSNTFLPFVDYTLNADVVQYESYKWNLTFIYIYACFVWIFVAASAISYPYFFLDTSAFGGYTFGVYTGLLLLNGLFYLFVLGVFRGLKLHYLLPNGVKKELLVGVTSGSNVVGPGAMRI